MGGDLFQGVHFSPEDLRLEFDFIVLLDAAIQSHNLHCHLKNWGWGVTRGQRLTITVGGGGGGHLLRGEGLLLGSMVIALKALGS